MNETERDEIIIGHLASLNRNTERQLSVWHIFLTGIIYGVGFVVGTTIFATVLLHVLGILFDDVPLLRPIVEIVRTEKAP